MRNKAELLDYMQRRDRQGEGYAALGELGDAYPSARQHLEVGCGCGGGGGWRGGATRAAATGTAAAGPALWPALPPAASCQPPSAGSRPPPPPLQELKREGVVLSLPAADTARKEVFYPVDQRLQLRVDSDVQVCVRACVCMGSHRLQGAARPPLAPCSLLPHPHPPTRAPA